MQPNPRYDHAYAIVRVDTFQGPDVAWENKITVKSIVSNAAAARAEVERLNQLNKDKGCIYFWQITRLEKEAPEASPLSHSTASDGSSRKE
jgi:hypothetical protein